MKPTICLIALLFFQPAWSQTKQKDRFVLIESSTSLYPEPKLSLRNRIGRLEKGQVVRHTGSSKGNFREVELDDGTTGWVENSWTRLLADHLVTKYQIRSSPVWVKVYEANVRDAAGTDGNVVERLMVGKQLFVQGDSGEWLQVKWQGGQSENDLSDGWIHESLISREEVTRDDQRRVLFVNTNQLNARTRQDVLKGTIRIGMAKDVVEASLGRPVDINRTVTANVVREQWVYGNGGPYVYIENGKVVSWQD